MSTRLSLGILDIAPARIPGTAGASLRAMRGTAPKLERAGYSRYWIAEHHEIEYAHSSPEILTAAVAGVTTAMRVGTAGVLLRYQAPLRVAKNFRALQALFPGRIDLGIARGAAGDPTVHALLCGDGPTTCDYAARVRDLVGCLCDSSAISFNPIDAAPGPVWVLGSSLQTAQLAADVGAAFCLGLSSNVPAEDPRSVVAEYRERFRPSDVCQAPTLALAVAGVCAEKEQRARELASTAMRVYKASVVGTGSECRDRLLESARILDVADVVYIELGCILDERQASYELLADACGLTQPAASAARPDAV